MGEMKNGIYTGVAERKDHKIHFRLRDHARRVVAEGSGETVTEAQQNALEKAVDPGAQKYLAQVKFPEGLAAPNVGDIKPCIHQCGGTMTWRLVRPPDAAFTKDDAQIPERLPSYEAWVCSDCGFEQRGSD